MRAFASSAACPRPLDCRRAASHPQRLPPPPRRRALTVEPSRRHRTLRYEQRLAALEEQRVKDLERQLVALTGTADEQAAMLEEKAKEERIELMKKQSMRRMLNAALSGAWGAWLEMWEAKVYATERLKLCGNRLHAPEKTKVFTKWKDEWRAEVSANSGGAARASVAALSCAVPCTAPPCAEAAR